MSGRSSLSTFTQTKALLRSAETSSSMKDSLSITWHQWQLEYPIERNIGFFFFGILFDMAYMSSIADGEASERGGNKVLPLSPLRERVEPAMSEVEGVRGGNRQSFDSSTSSLLRTNDFNRGRRSYYLFKKRRFAKISLRLYNALKNKEVAHETSYYLPRRRRLLGRRMSEPSGMHKPGQDKRRGRGKHKRGHRALHRRT